MKNRKRKLKHINDFKISYALMFTVILLLIAGCSTKYKQTNVVLDHDWDTDIQNILTVELDAFDNFLFWIKEKPTYIDGSLYQIGCVETRQSNGEKAFYLINVSTYTTTKIANCDIAYQQAINNTPNRANAANTVATHNHDQLSKLISEFLYIDPKNIHIKFEGLFNVNETQLTEEGMAALRMIITKLTKLPVNKIAIYGVADSSGSYINNQTLANLRALEVRKYLLNAGFQENMIILRGSVENKLLTAEERKLQRRFMLEVNLK